MVYTIFNDKSRQPVRTKSADVHWSSRIMLLRESLYFDTCTDVEPIFSLTTSPYSYYSHYAPEITRVLGSPDGSPISCSALPSPLGSRLG
jgi:hypothetical protein